VFIAYNRPVPSRSRRWIPVVLWVAAIYTTIPFVGVVLEWFVARWDPIFIGLAVATVLVGAAVVTLVVLTRRTQTPPLGNMLWIIGTTAVFVIWTFSLKQSPQEAVHFLEYGVLAIFLHRALRPSMPSDLVFIAAALIGALVGTVDEIIQWISSSRVWDWRDLALNGGASVLAQLILWRAVGSFGGRTDRRSVRIIIRLAAAQLVLLTLCLANTPARVARYAPFFPNTGHLTSSRNPMAEYGHRFSVPGLGSFTSRLSTAELEFEDRTRATDVAALVDQSRGQYGKFLDSWPVSEDPFTYEARVHLYSRDRNMAKARERNFTGSIAMEQLTTAWHENRLMEEFFSRTLEQSSFTWGPRFRRRIKSTHDADSQFRSAAGSHLITIASERTLRSALMLLVAVMIIADLFMSRSHGRRS